VTALIPQAAIERARPYAADVSERYDEDRIRCGEMDSDPLVQAFAKAIADEQERCARKADDAAKEAERIGLLLPEDSDSRSRMFARSREASAIANSIRGVTPNAS
jgi:hypothetical protein